MNNSAAHIPSPNIVVTAPLSVEARALHHRLNDELAPVNRAFSGSFTTPASKAAALKKLMAAEKTIRDLKREMRR